MSSLKIQQKDISGRPKQFTVLGLFRLKTVTAYTHQEIFATESF
jgi:hypothetical protein